MLNPENSENEKSKNLFLIRGASAKGSEVAIYAKLLAADSKDQAEAAAIVEMQSTFPDRSHKIESSEIPDDFVIQYLENKGYHCLPKPAVVEMQSDLDALLLQAQTLRIQQQHFSDRQSQEQKTIADNAWEIINDIHQRLSAPTHEHHRTTNENHY